MSKTNNNDQNQRNEDILQNLQAYFGVKIDNVQAVSKEDIIEKCKIQSSKLNEFSKLEDFSEKLQKLYLSLNDSKEKRISVKILWRWIKNVIKHLSNQSKLNVNNNVRLLDYEQDNVGYRSICEQLIKEYNLKDINELKRHMEELMSKNEKNKQRVDKMKKILLTSLYIF